MSAENKIWIVSVQSKKDQHHVQAASVKEDDGKLIFTDVQCNLAGSFYLTEVQGYSAEPASTSISVADVLRQREERLDTGGRA